MDHLIQQNPSTVASSLAMRVFTVERLHLRASLPREELPLPQRKVHEMDVAEALASLTDRSSDRSIGHRGGPRLDAGNSRKALWTP
jgi:hypothetical protein